MRVLFFFLSLPVPDLRDGGLQRDRWAGGPQALCCDCEPGAESGGHGVSDLRQTRRELLREAPDPP